MMARLKRSVAFEEDYLIRLASHDGRCAHQPVKPLDITEESVDVKATVTRVAVPRS